MRKGGAQAVARALGWFSIGLGLAGLLAPRLLARAAGLQGRERMLRLYGVRELASGISILLARNPRPWVAGRLVGDAVDMATLIVAGNKRSVAALAAVGGVTALDAYATAALKPQARPYFDYSTRSGFSRPASEMRGAAAGKVREKRQMKPGSEPVFRGEQRLEHSPSR